MSASVEALTGPHLEPHQVFAGWHDTPGAVWLDGGHTAWSVLVRDPAEVVTTSDSWPEAGRALTRATPRTTDLPFVQGVVGYIGYEAAAAVLPQASPRTTPEPPVHLGRYEGALLFHGPTQRWWVTGDSATRDRLRAHLVAAEPPPRTATAQGRSRSTDEAAWTRAVERVQELLRAGDAYQINLTRVVHVERPRPPWEAWLRLRDSTRPERGAYLVTVDGCTVVSASPERLLDVRDGFALTVPIKGTRPRGSTPAEDQRLAAELEASAKEQAELVMIVDLCRNDLGRVAVPGSVRAAPRTLVPTPYCHHAAAEVSAQLRTGCDAWDALAALFPPGSVTGAPKVRAVQRIHELEPEARGVYCGAVGYVADHGRAAWSVAIRTAVWAGSEARYHVGGGIVVDSEAHAEWLETLVKGQRLEAALTGD